jgi:hypothetical protein
MSATGDSFADEAYAVTAAAYARAPGEWEAAVREAIAGLFGFLSGQAGQTKACVAGEHAHGLQAIASRDREIERFVALLQQGYEGPSSPPAVVAEAIGGGIYEIVRSHALDRRLDELPASAPAATVIALSPFVGSERANAVAATGRVQTMS